MNLIQISLGSIDQKSVSTDPGLIQTQFARRLRPGIYAQASMVEQIDDSVVPTNTRLFIGAYWCFQAQNTPHKALALDDGLKLLNKAGETSYDAVELSLILDNQPFSAPEYSPGKKARIYRIADHNQVYSEVKVRFLAPANFSTLPSGSNSKASQ